MTAIRPLAVAEAALIPMIKAADSLIEVVAPSVDLLALFVVGFILWRNKNLVTAVVFTEFVFVFFFQDWLQSLDYWGSKGLDYHYGMALKDGAFAVLLAFLRANPLLIFVYGVASVLSWAVWGFWVLLQSGALADWSTNYHEAMTMTEMEWNSLHAHLDAIGYQVWYAWSPLYFLCMIAEIVVLAWSGGNAGKRSRSRIHAARRGWNVSVVDFTLSHLPAGKGRNTQNPRKVAEKE